jgi:hypothetical protein
MNPVYSMETGSRVFRFFHPSYNMLNLESLKSERAMTCCHKRQRFTTSQTFTTEPIWRNPNTEIVVTFLNEDPNVSQTVTVSVLDWQNTCNPTEFDADKSSIRLCQNQAFNRRKSTSFLRTTFNRSRHLLRLRFRHAGC